MHKDLIITALINFTYTIIRALTYAFGCFLAWRAFDIMDKVDIREEITQNRNWGWAIMIATIFGGLAYVIGQM